MGICSRKLINGFDLAIYPDQVQYLDELATGRARTALARLRSGKFFQNLALVRLATAVKSDSNNLSFSPSKLLETQFIANLCQ